MSDSTPALGSATDFAWTTEWGQRLLAVLGILLVTRFAGVIPLPGLDLSELQKMPFNKSDAWTRLSLTALGLAPFIYAWILTEVFRGNRSESLVAQDRRWLAVVFALFQGWGYAAALENIRDLVLEPGMEFRLTVMASLTAGTMLLVWLGEQISKLGICDGIWLLTAVWLVAGAPEGAWQSIVVWQHGLISTEHIVLFVVALVAIVALIVLFECATYPLRLTATRPDVKPETSTWRLKLDHANVFPGFLAGTLLALPASLDNIASIQTDWGGLSGLMQRGQALHLATLGVLVLLGTYIATAAEISPRAVAIKLHAEGRTIEGVAQEAVANALDLVVSRLATVNGLFLAAVAIVPELLFTQLNVPAYYGGTSLLITVIVMLDIISRARRTTAPRST